MEERGAVGRKYSQCHKGGKWIGGSDLLIGNPRVASMA
jgi:hypothetical protein